MSKATQPNMFLGLNSDKLDESNINQAVWKYVAKEPKAAPPKGTVGKCQTMRERILQMSLFPDIYDRKKPRQPGNVDMGESHGY